MSDLRYDLTKPCAFTLQLELKAIADQKTRNWFHEQIVKLCVDLPDVEFKSDFKADIESLKKKQSSVAKLLSAARGFWKSDEQASQKI